MTSRILVDHIYRHARSTPDKLALAHDNRAVSYGELWRRILNAAAQLRDLGVRPQDRVLLAALWEPDFVYAYFACHRLGAVAVPVAAQVPAETLAAIVETLRPRLACLAKPQDLDCSCTTLPRSGVDELAPSGDLEFPDPGAPADILLTSGTTGKPKGVVLGHRSIVAAARNINAFIGNTAEDRELIALPLNHSFGLGRLRCQMLAGGAVIFSEGLLFPKKLFAAMELWKATGFAFVPAGWSMLTRLTGEKLADFSNQLRYIEIGSAPMPREQKERLIRLFPLTRICMHYGLTEASRSVFIELHESADHLDSIGKSAPNVKIRIVDAEGRDVGAGETGAIMIRGDHVMTGYWNTPAEPRPPDAWLPSGDMGYRSDDGYLYLCGRVDDVINVGGRKVYPAEVEGALRQHDIVADCVCIGMTDPRKITGESVVAFLVARENSGDLPGLRELTDFLINKLELFKIPVAYEWISAIPRNANGKAERGQLRTQAMSRLSGMPTRLEVQEIHDTVARPRT